LSQTGAPVARLNLGGINFWVMPGLLNDLKAGAGVGFARRKISRAA
jgi:hypothetical protein